jgi:hypothetical protein
MKTLLIFTSILVLAAGCASNNKNTGAPPATVTTETVYVVPAAPVTTKTVYVAPATGYILTTTPQPGQISNNGWYVIPTPP